MMVKVHVINTRAMMNLDQPLSMNQTARQTTATRLLMKEERPSKHPAPSWLIKYERHDLCTWASRLLLRTGDPNPSRLGQVTAYGDALIALFRMDNTHRKHDDLGPFKDSIKSCKTLIKGKQTLFTLELLTDNITFIGSLSIFTDWKWDLPKWVLMLKKRRRLFKSGTGQRVLLPNHHMQQLLHFN